MTQQLYLYGFLTQKFSIPPDQIMYQGQNVSIPPNCILLEIATNARQCQ